MQVALHQAAIMDISQPMERFGQAEGTSVELRQEILEVRSVRLQFAQVRPQIGVGEVGKTNRRYVSLQHEVTIVMHSYILHHH